MIVREMMEAVCRPAPICGTAGSAQMLHEIGRALGEDHVGIRFVLARPGGPPQYRASEADHQACKSALRPKPCPLATHSKLQEIVASKLIQDRSPEQFWFGVGKKDLHSSSAS